MSLDVTVAATWAGGRPLAELARLVQMRQRWLGESAKDAVIATAIDALVSLRSLTRRAKPGRVGKPRVAPTALVPSFTGGRKNPRRVLRVAGKAGGRDRAAKYGGAERVKWLAPKSVKAADLRVFLVGTEHAAVRPYLAVAESAAAAAAFERRAAGHRVRRFGGLAKWAFGVAMRALSTRNVSDDVNAETAAAASRLSKVRRYSDGAGGYAVRVTDALAYAADALRGGSGAVDLALMRAANKIAGRMAHRFGDALGPDFSTPFPEVKRRRR